MVHYSLVELRSYSRVASKTFIVFWACTRIPHQEVQKFGFLSLASSPRSWRRYGIGFGYVNQLRVNCIWSPDVNKTHEVAKVTGAVWWLSSGCKSRALLGKTHAIRLVIHWRPPHCDCVQKLEYLG